MRVRKRLLGAIAAAAATMALLGAEADASGGKSPRGTAIGSGRTTFYVAPWGNDRHNGTAHRPFATLARARDAVRSVNTNMRRDVTVELYGGTYRLTKPLMLTPGDSGTNGHFVVYRAVDGQRPVITGARRVTGWRLYDAAKGIYRARVGALRSRQLYVDGIRATRARSEEFPAGFTATSTGFTAPDGTIASWPDADQLELVGTAAFRMHRCGVASVSGTTITAEQPCWTNARLEPGVSLDKLRWLENAYELLDAPREWYLSTDGWLYYKPGAGENLSNADVELPVLEQLIDGRGSLHTPISHVRFEGITFTAATWLQPSSSLGYADLQAGFHVTQTPANPGWTGERTPGAVTVEHDRDVTFARNRFEHLGAVGLDLGTGTQRATVIGNRFDDISGSGLQLGGIEPADHHPADSADETTGNTVDDNVVTDVGAEYWDTVGLFFGYVNHTTVAHNEVSNLPYTAISLGWGWGSTDAGGNPEYPDNGGNPVYDTPTTSHDNLVSANRITDVMLRSYDGGGIYNLGASPGTVVRENMLTDLPAVPGTNARRRALYADEGTKNVLWTRNVLSNVQTWVSARPGNVITNNWTDSPTSKVLEPNVFTDNVLVADGQWPVEACRVAGLAGLEPSYVGVRGDTPAPRSVC